MGLQYQETCQRGEKRHGLLLFHHGDDKLAQYESSDGSNSCRGDIVQARDTVLNESKMNSKEKKLVLSSVKTEWKRRVVMTNSSVAAGLNFIVEN